MNTVASKSSSDLVREYAQETYISPARRRREKTVTINVGQIQKGVGLQNRVSLVCQALKSEKFLRAHGLKLISETGPPSGQSTTVTYTYEFLDAPPAPAGTDAWDRLRGALKDVFAELGGGEAYLRAERAAFRDASDRK
ncbi:MAG: hypothetical protein LAO09_05965 [Acidobacteriia bacterium]|nr:hypothetical protein [Terriglobia bacterium]